MYAENMLGGGLRRNRAVHIRVGPNRVSGSRVDPKISIRVRVGPTRARDCGSACRRIMCVWVQTVSRGPRCMRFTASMIWFCGTSMYDIGTYDTSDIRTFTCFLVQVRTYAIHYSHLSFFNGGQTFKTAKLSDGNDKGGRAFFPARYGRFCSCAVMLRQASYTSIL